MPDSDYEIVNRPSDSLYREYAQQGIRFAYGLLGNRSDAEEAVQEAFFRLHKSEAKHCDVVFRGRFFATLRNHCIDRIRKNQVRKEVSTASEETTERAARESVGLAGAEYRELVGVVESAIAKLPERWGRAFSMKTNDELSYDEIAVQMESTTAQVRTWIYRARRQIEEELTEAGFMGNSS